MHIQSNFKAYHRLMSYRVREIMVISNPYDAFIMEEDGGLLEHVFMSYRGISLAYPPRFTMVSTEEEALNYMSKRNFDLVVIMPRYSHIDIFNLGKKLKKISPQVPVVLLVHSARGLAQYDQHGPQEGIDKVFVWSGNRNILWAILKWMEDQMNVETDTEASMVRVIIFVEDSPLYYSSLLPTLYEAVVQQTLGILEDGLNEEHRLLKVRARPKVLLATSYENAMELFEKFKPYILGIFSDVRFPKAGVQNYEAGFLLLKKIKEELPFLPSLLISSEEKNRQKAQDIGAQFLDKNSPSIHLIIKRFFTEHLGFGDFIFKLPNGEEAGRARTIKSMEKVLRQIPEASIRHHAMGHDFSNWFMARSQIILASKLKSSQIKDFESIEEIRKFLVSSIRETRLSQQKGVVSILNTDAFDNEFEFTKIGEGSLGGKARGLAFMSKRLQREMQYFKKYPQIKVNIPRTLVLTTDIFKEFVHDNNLEIFSELECPDEVIASRFIEAKLPASLVKDLMLFLEIVNYPLAIRSSSLLEDSLFEPFAGLYKTYMLPNNDPNIHERFRQLSRAIRLIYASVFYADPKAFSRSTLHRTEEEQMAISIQQLMGRQYGDYFYPTISGTAQTYNYYPVGHTKADEGVARIAMGLGKIVVDGGQSIRFSPKYPQYLPQFSSVKSTLENAQNNFYALRMNHPPNQLHELWIDDDVNLERRSVFDALDEGKARSLTSTYRPSDDRIIDFQSNEGAPILTFANILKHKSLPLPELLLDFLDMGKKGLGCDIEIEYALDLNPDKDKHNFSLLQIRPMITPFSTKQGDLSKETIKKAVAYSTKALGRGKMDNVTDIIYVMPDVSISQNSVEIAQQLSEINAQFKKEQRKYLLIGIGRWGSQDRMLGIPVKWKDICSASGIIEISTPDFRVDPSQGTHFFQNITSLGVIYLTIYDRKDFLDWKWLERQKLVKETKYIRHVQSMTPLVIEIDRNNHGVLTI